jgi:acyl-coenzyme A synthetase/AMP-(fatty) acid ligase
MYSVCCEAIFETHPHVARAALIGLGKQGEQYPVIVIEPLPDRYPENYAAELAFRAEMLQVAKGSFLTANIDSVRFHRSFPVDTRHNVKIQREALAKWADEQNAR